MDLIISPKNSFKEEDKKNLMKIISLAENILKKNSISIPSKIYFFNSFSLFSKKVLPEVQNYGFSKKVSKEIIFCALNNGTYGTINYKENAIIEMNFNPFNKGEYSSLDFLELIIHESLHLHLYNLIKKDINNQKFKCKGDYIISNPKITQFDEGYAGFMTNKLLININFEQIERIKIPQKNFFPPKYTKKIEGINIQKFDHNFENFFLLNKDLGIKIFSKKFKINSKNQLILSFAKSQLKNFI